MEFDVQDTSPTPPAGRILPSEQGSERSTDTKKILFPSWLMMTVGALVAILFAFRSRSDNPVISSEILMNLRKYGVPEFSPALTFLHTGLGDGSFSPLTSSVGDGGTGDTTAVILNWSRLENVILLTSLLCGHWLDTAIAKVVIWNNNPRVKLTFETFAATGCPPGRLRIVNSKENMLFRARFMACAEADTTYCFFQDDDYLIQPQVIKNLHDFAKERSIQSIHLLPPYEHMQSNIRTFYALEGRLQTTFAWLGHGTLANRTSVQHFLGLIGPNELNLTTEEMEMADNYFTILSNHDKREDLWLDHGIELGGGQPFTVGQTGDDRNDRHIAKALEYLNSMITQFTENDEVIRNKYVDTTMRERPVQRPVHRISHTPCLLTSCVLSTNIDLLPSYYEEARDTDLATVRRRRHEVVNEAHRTRYMDHPLSNVVDGRADTVFISIEDVKAGDWIALDSFAPFSQQEDHAIEIALLVDGGTARTLQNGCSVQPLPFDASQEDLETPESPPFTCLELLSHGDNDNVVEWIYECSARFHTPVRGLKIIFNQPPDGDERNAKYGRWKVYEIWLRLVV